ncbi:MAG: hypothetical protein FWC13_11810 [Oscillospiraceae bacterium]|nr:hypothetical protein [Oscillospiraceae bacterium]
MSDNSDLSDKVSDKLDLSDKMSDKSDLSDKMSDKAQYDIIISYLNENLEISMTKTAEILNCHPKTAQRILSKLTDEGELEKIGANKNRKYKLVKN